ncbi:MAG: hypothetical protein AB8B83_04810 [Bdellovibrionales bacterium]
MRVLNFIFFAFLVSFSLPAYAQQSCLNADIRDEVKAVLKDDSPNSRLVMATKQVEIGIAKGVIKAENKNDLISAITEYTVRKSGACNVPNVLKDRVARSIAFTSGVGKACADGQFEKVINRQFNALRSSEGYAAFEGIIKEQISDSVIPVARDVFIQKWDSNEGFRERVIKAGLELNVMYSNQCNNLADPVLGIVAEF